MSSVIELTDVWKNYLKLKSVRALLRYLRRGNEDHEESFWALQAIDIAVGQGEALGLVGANGAGKSTILRLIAKITKPTRGSVRTRGRVAALINLSAGFHRELSGRENVYLQGIILGMHRREIDRKFESIVEFAELHEFIDSPTKHYSTGMTARLGFSLAVHIEPEVLLVDEVLSVGDMSFQQKCLWRMRDLLGEGRTLVFVSHGMWALQRLCHRIIWLDHGQLRQEGPPHEVIRRYVDAMHHKTLGRTNRVQPARPQRGTGEVRITQMITTDSQGAPCTAFTMGEALHVRMHYRTTCQVTDLRFRFFIRHVPTDVWVTGCEAGDDTWYPPQAESMIECIFDPIVLRPGIYGLYVGIFSADKLRLPYDERWDSANERIMIKHEGAAMGRDFIAGSDEGLVSVPYSIRHDPILATSAPSLSSWETLPPLEADPGLADRGHPL